MEQSRIVVSSRYFSMCFTSHAALLGGADGGLGNERPIVQGHQNPEAFQPLGL